MRDALDEAKVTEAYKAFQETLRLTDEHLRGSVGLLGRNQSAPLKVEAAALGPIVDGLARLSDSVTESRRLLGPLDDELSAMAAGPIDSPPFTVTSWAELAVLHGERYAEDLEGWREVSPSDEPGLRRLIGAVSDCMPIAPRIRSNLRIEEAKLRERARAKGPEVRYGYEFDQLRPQPRRLLRLMTEREGRWVDYQEIAASVLDDPEAANGRIQKAMSRLKDDLRRMGSDHVQNAIESEPGRYRLR